MQQRNARAIEDPVPLDLLECHDAEKVCKFMRLFVLEARKVDGQPYPPGTILGLLGLSMVLQFIAIVTDSVSFWQLTCMDASVCCFLYCVLNTEFNLKITQTRIKNIKKQKFILVCVIFC